MSDPISQFYRVLEYAPSMQSVQSMESRDFQNKGIFKLFTSISEWTDKYLANKALPNIDQLAREVGLEREKVEAFIQELCFKGPTPMVKKITTVEFDPSNQNKSETVSAILKRNTVFARPPSLDAGSSQRYVNSCNEASVAAIKKGIAANRIPWKGDKFRDYLFGKINENKLSDTYASADIGTLFNCPYDTNKTLKDSTVNLHLKPILKKLVDDKVLLFFRNEAAPKSSNKSIFLYNTKEEIFERIEIYITYLKRYVIPGFQKIGVISEVGDEELRNIGKLTSVLLGYMDDTYGDQKVVVEELSILSGYYDAYKDEQAKKELRDKVQEVVKLLESQARLTDVATIRLDGQPFPKELIPQLYSHESVLHTEYNDGNRLFDFILHKSSIPIALENAKKLYEVSENDSELRILARMNVANYVDNAKRQEFISAETASLFRYLPFFTRMWRMLLGNIYVTQREAELIRAQKEAEQKKRIAEAKAKDIAKEKARIVDERMRGQGKENPITSTAKALLGETPATETQVTALDFEAEKRVKEVQKAVISILDTAWDQNLRPDREYLVKELGGEIAEEELLSMLKKHFSKEILSFQVKSVSGGGTRHKWPILISKSYVKRKGKALLEKAMKITDEERSTVTPDQDRFDFWNSCEEFLNRVIGKI
ncbi:MAG TPA: hypothetical protein PK453_12005 [Leptospiraceae bacterium]|nr:hypothetical protein [Leptospiraceae bacterium]HNM03347.1 hypothetical protein [Leptospiraceae bacterium]HNN02986.1 hypothetical protein [Leptospiraceae bacterium]